MGDHDDEWGAVRLIKRGRRAEQRGEATKGCITALVAGVLTALGRGYRGETGKL